MFSHKLNYWCSIVFYSYEKRLGVKTIGNCQHSQLITGLDLQECLQKYLQKERMKERQRDLPNYLPNCLSNYLAANQGIAIHQQNDEVFLECNLPVYIQSPFFNHMNGGDANYVERLEPGNGGRRVKIFDNNHFKRLIELQFPKGYDAVHELIKFSKLTVSFFSGWNKHEILQKPAWLEITLDVALTTLDYPLQQLGSSNQQVTSVS